MTRKIPLTSPLYDSVYGGNFPEEQYFIVLFDKIPSKRESQDVYKDEIIKYFLSTGFKEHSRLIKDRDRHVQQSTMKLLVHEGKNMIISTRSRNHKGEGLVSFDVLYTIEFGEFSHQLDMEKIKGFKSESVRSNIHLVKSDMGHLDTEEYDLNIPNCDLSLNYGEQFIKLHDTMIKRLNKNYDKGIVLFHGDPGTGKTTYIKILTKHIKEKEILFIPPAMAEMLSDPSIITFLMDYKNSILLIEDAEKVIGDRQSNGSQAGVSNILNLTDGILGDCLNIQVIATFNMPRERIDPALLRKGRLIAEHRFEKLNVDDTNKLLKYLGKDVTSNVPLSLADIYNIDSDDNKITIDRSPVGFQFGKK